MARRGPAGLRAELAKQWKWRLPFPLWVLVLLAPAAIILIAVAIAQGLGAPVGEWNDPAQLYLTIPVFLYVVVLGGPLGEEFGWRGFALPRLEQRLHPIAAVILLGLIWGLWHLPLFCIEGTVQQLTPFTAFLAQTTVTSVIYGWLWNTTKSLPAVVVIHAATNTTVGLLPVLPDAAHSMIPLWTTISVAAVIALVLTIWTRGRLGYRVDTASAHPSP
ncbi:MAG TPA: CPBP family intramembrane glutamic endopeptidase [Acidimicrobiia bacterium]|nr:CPBP family intramembrane glutamic endopeptidase [Acidimicrobiia bacterium]